MIINHVFLSENSNIQLLAPREQLNFYDSQSVVLPEEITAPDAWRMIVSNPLPIMKLAFQIRDKISSCFGVKPIKGFSGQWPDNIQVGDQLDFFLVEHISPSVLTLTARDKHLDVMTCITTDKTELTITSSVKTHNLFGRLYMLPVAIAHRLIVRSDLKRLKHKMIKDQSPLA
ncbi:DUF2867 domain-containing protein [Kiloniella majae]|uniref:DUF2867 domain-containing protein n=1 Tax=Kiloniella majae TaxID=1938558 RepID=UPI001C3F5FDA|nr:DUF2867 domain-containing protein [Kiloniella majae]